MFPAKPSADRSITTHRHQPRKLHAALKSLTLGMRDLEEQLPLPADRLVRDSTAARQKATALRAEIEDLSLRLTRIKQQFTSMSRTGQ